MQKFDLVIIHGLVSPKGKQFNDRVGKLYNYVESKERWEVQLTHREKYLGLRSANLRQVAPIEALIHFGASINVRTQDITPSFTQIEPPDFDGYNDMLTTFVEVVIHAPEKLPYPVCFLIDMKKLPDHPEVAQFRKVVGIDHETPMADIEIVIVTGGENNIGFGCFYVDEDEFLQQFETLISRGMTFKKEDFNCAVCGEYARKRDGKFLDILECAQCSKFVCEDCFPQLKAPICPLCRSEKVFIRKGEQI